MSVFVDTSAFFAYVDKTDEFHNLAERRWYKLLDSGETIATSNYIVVETSSIIQNRLGMDILRVFYEKLLPVVTIHWIDEKMHDAAFFALILSGRRGLSLADCTSFEVMRNLGIREVFTFDKHFKEYGFKIFT